MSSSEGQDAPIELYISTYKPTNLPPLRVSLNGCKVFPDYAYRKDTKWINHPNCENITFEVPVDERQHNQGLNGSIELSKPLKLGFKNWSGSMKTTANSQSIVSSGPNRLKTKSEYETQVAQLREYLWKGRMKCLERHTKIESRYSCRLTEKENGAKHSLFSYRDHHLPSDQSIWLDSAWPTRDARGVKPATRPPEKRFFQLDELPVATNVVLKALDKARKGTPLAKQRIYLRQYSEAESRLFASPFAQNHSGFAKQRPNSTYNFQEKTENVRSKSLKLNVLVKKL